MKSEKTAKHLGVTFDEELSYQSHVTTVDKVAYQQLYHIHHARYCFMTSAATTNVHAFAISSLYSLNVVHGFPKCTNHLSIVACEDFDIFKNSMSISPPGAIVFFKIPN